MESTPKPHHEEFENLVNRAHEEALKDNSKVDELEMELREAKGIPQEEGTTYESVSPEKVSATKLPEMEGKPFSEVIEYVREKFGDRYIIPGEGYLMYLQNHPEKTPDTLKGVPGKGVGDGAFYMAYFLGSERRNDKGQMSVAGGVPPFSFYDEGKGVQINSDGWQSWPEDHLALSAKFMPNYQIVLIEKNSEFSKAVEGKTQLVKTEMPVENSEVEIDRTPELLEVDSEETLSLTKPENAIENVEAVIDYETINPEKVKILPLPEMVGKPYPEVVKYINEKFSEEYYIPGKRYMEYLNGAGRYKRPRVFDNDKAVNFFGMDSKKYLSISELVKITGSNAVWTPEENIVLIEK